MNPEKLDGNWINESVQTRSMNIKDGIIISMIMDGVETIKNNKLYRKIESFPTEYSHFFDLDNKKVILLLSPKIIELYEMGNDIFEFREELKIGRYTKI